GGAITLVYWAEPRGTTDIDINIFLRASEAVRTFGLLSLLGIEIPAGAADEARARDQVRLPWGETPVDLFFSFDPFHDSCLSRRVRTTFRGRDTWVLSAEDAVIFKVVFNRRKDWPDIEMILKTQGSRFDMEYAESWLTRMLGAEDRALLALRELWAEVSTGANPTD
ncbi:MAG: hypothetical protein WED87_06575, partial [Dehalococcoidia bacterium]